MKKLLTRILAVAMIVCTLVCTALPAFADSKTTKTISSVTYTITTDKKKDCTLTITPKNGTIAQKWVNGKKSKVCTNNITGTYDVTINGKKYTVSGTKKITLKKNTTYTITIKYTGYWQAYCESLPGIAGIGWKRSGAKYWKSNPSLKLDTGWGGAKIK